MGKEAIVMAEKSYLINLLKKLDPNIIVIDTHANCKPVKLSEFLSNHRFNFYSADSLQVFYDAYAPKV
jgi:hypothetical protein